jgi:hypothetical protein
MSGTPKVSISVPDEALLQWAKERSERTGLSLSAVFTGALRFERQLEARRLMLEEMGPEFRATPEERAAIRAEWEGGPRWDPKGARATKAKKKTVRSALSKKRRAA